MLLSTFWFDRVWRLILFLKVWVCFRKDFCPKNKILIFEITRFKKKKIWQHWLRLKSVIKLNIEFYNNIKWIWVFVPLEVVYFQNVCQNWRYNHIFHDFKILLKFITNAFCEKESEKFYHSNKEKRVCYHSDSI